MPDPRKGVAFTFEIALKNLAANENFVSSPSIASGDFQIRKSGGSLTNLTNLPTSAGVSVFIALTAMEMSTGYLSILGHSQTGAWDDILITIQTTQVTIDDGPFLIDAVIDTHATVTSLKGSDSLPTDDSFCLNSSLVFTSGANKGVARKISNYVGATRTFTVTSAWAETPALGDQFMVIGLLE